MLSHARRMRCFAGSEALDAARRRSAHRSTSSFATGAGSRAMSGVRSGSSIDVSPTSSPIAPGRAA
jgi:hypothetical protein